MAQGGGWLIMKREEIRRALKAVSPVSMADAEHPNKGFHLEVTVTPERLVQTVGILDQEGFFIETITGVDWLGEKAALNKEAAAKDAAKAKAATEAGETASPAAAAEAGPKAQEDDVLEVVYDFNRYDAVCRVVLRVRTPRNKPRVPSISGLYQGALWHERETHDFFGIDFEGHPCLAPLLLPEDADFHPLLKDFNK